MSCVLQPDNVLHAAPLYRVVYELVGTVLPCWLSYVIAGLVIMVILVNAVLLGAAVFVWSERRLIGRFHNRIGPNRWGPFGMFQPFADLLKLDKQNRIRLNPEMCKFCNITREVIIVGTLKYMQIFDRGVWNTLVRKGMSKFGGAADAVAAKAAEPAPVQLIVQARTGPETG